MVLLQVIASATVIAAIVMGTIMVISASKGAAGAAVVAHGASVA